MAFVTSEDGTKISYEKTLERPALIYVFGATGSKGRTLVGQSHQADPKVLTPTLIEYFVRI